MILYPEATNCDPRIKITNLELLILPYARFLFKFPLLNKKTAVHRSKKTRTFWSSAFRSIIELIKMGAARTPISM